MWKRADVFCKPSSNNVVLTGHCARVAVSHLLPLNIESDKHSQRWLFHSTYQQIKKPKKTTKSLINFLNSCTKSSDKLYCVGEEGGSPRTSVLQRSHSLEVSAYCFHIPVLLLSYEWVLSWIKKKPVKCLTWFSDNRRNFEKVCFCTKTWVRIAL
jgi:hypothetical protein